MNNTEIDHHPKRPDVWMARFKAHIDLGIRAARLVGDERDTAREFLSDLEDARIDHLVSTDDDRDRQYLLRVKAIADQALFYYTRLELEQLRVTIESLRLDLDGLNEVIAPTADL